ncbi:MAG: OmpA family protein [Bacteroidales bacterium]|nr:OmpA family protein [Bacteroidales bacterium]
MFRKILIFVSASIIAGYASAQENPKINEDTFFANSEGAEDAWENLTKGEKYYKKGMGFYDEAVKYYLKAYDYNSKSFELNYKIGICLLAGSDRASSLKYFQGSSPIVSRDYYLMLGRAYQYNNMYDDAKHSYENYLNSANKRMKKKNKGRVHQYIEECLFAEEIMKDSVAVFITNLGPLINTYYDDYNAMLAHHDSILIFTSRRPDEEPAKRESRFKFYEQIYASNNCIKDPCDSVWQFDRLKSGKNYSIAGYNKDEDIIFIYKGKRQNGKLYTAYRDGDEWTKPKPIRGQVNHVAYKEGSVAVDKNNTIYFVSKRRGGYGSTDIWVAEYKGNNKWYKPYNIGNKINTPFDEESLYVNAEGTVLYFSSNGHRGMGGYDVYKSTLNLSDSTWSEPKNLGYPINSPADELFYYQTPDTNVAMYATMRKEGYGGLDIYSVINDLRKPFYYNCKGVDKETGAPITITYSIVNDTTSEVMYSDVSEANKTPNNHFFEDHGRYIISYSSEGYHAYTDTVEYPEDKYATASQTFRLEKLMHPFTISGIVTEKTKGVPIGANIEFRSSDGKVLGKTTSSSITGKYAYSFEDKIDFVVEATAKDYCDTTATVKATQSADKVINQDIKMRVSRLFYTLCGTIKNEKDQSPVYSALIFYPLGKSTPELTVYSDSVSSKYSANLLTKGPYWVDIEAPGYFFANDAIQFGKDEQLLTRNYLLKKMDAGVKIVIENILFNTGKATLKPSSFEELDKFAKLLVKNPKVCIEVSGHTDNVGAASYNKKLSKQRALTVKNYLVNHGVEDERITYEGYGMEQPIESNSTAAGRAKNRRVEIQVLK